MFVLVIQAIILLALLAAVIVAAFYFPYPSPVTRRWLPPRKRWPERQIRDWLGNGRFQPAFLRYFYRNPERAVPSGSSVLAPADGLITSAEVLGGTRYVVIALSFWDMHVQRSPLSGSVTHVEGSGASFMDGEGRQFAFLREKPCPVQERIVIATAAGELAVRLITSLAARRIEVWVNEGEQIERGQRIGRILLGSTVVLELPVSVDLLVQVGERVKAGETPLARVLVAT